MKQNKISQANSRCGLNCHQCPAYIATVTNNDDLRQKTATEWNKRYNTTGRRPISKDDINCLGCLSIINPVYKHCKECGVRMCGIEKRVQNCGECNQYTSCPKIASLHKQIPKGKLICDEISKIDTKTV